MRYLVIMNPSAGRGRHRSPESIEIAFSKRGLSCELLLTRHAGHAAELVAEHGRDFETIVVVGGDGTLHEAIQTLDLGRHRLGLIPWGTGNDFAWLHKWPTDLDACLDRITAGDERQIDLGFWEGKTFEGKLEGRFHNSVGFGFEAVVNAESHRVKRVRGALVYVMALARAFPRYTNYRARLEWDGVGGCFMIAPDADPEDGKLDLVYAEAMNLFSAIQLVPRLLRGTHTRSPRVHVARSERILIQAPNGIPMYVDGEFIGYDLRAVSLRAEERAFRTF
jgi:diacylglycerol kinase (ATP)